MTKQEIIEQINSVLEKVDDEKVLQDFEKQLPMLLSEAELMLSETDMEPILAYLVHDKKNKREKPQFVLLEAVGKPVWDVEVEQ